jgi:hypothetical protein
MDAAAITAGLTIGLLANTTYDLLKISGSISYKGLKHLLLGREIPDSTLEKINSELNKLPLNDNMSADSVKSVILASEELTLLLATLQPSNTTTNINQVNINGDNVGIQNNY